MSHTEIVDLSSDKIYVRDLVNPSIDTSFNLVDSSLNVMHKNSMDISQNLKDLSDNVSTNNTCLLYTSPSPRDGLLSRMPSSA